MTIRSFRFATAIAAAAAGLSFATAAGASEKTHGDVRAPQQVASVETGDVARGEQNTRVGQYGRVQIGLGNQVAQLTQAQDYGK